MGDANEASIVDALAALDPARVEELLRAAERKREAEAAERQRLLHVAAETPPPLGLAGSDPSVNARKRERKARMRFCEPTPDAEFLECANAQEAPLPLDVACAEEWLLEEEEEESGDGPDAETAAQMLMGALEAGAADVAATAFRRASLEVFSESGWAGLHWAVHSACTSQNGADDCGQVGGCDCCVPKPANPLVRSLVLAILKTPKARRSIDFRTKDGATALMFAADANDVELVDLLLAAGADASLEDSDGDSAAAWARQKGHDGLARRLAALCSAQ